MMHELSITQSRIDLVVGECKKKNINSPKKIVAELGSLTGYSKESILFYYDLLRKEIPVLAETELDILEISAEISCNSCKKKSTITEPYMVFCNKCGSQDIDIICGREFIVKEIETND